MTACRTSVVLGPSMVDLTPLQDIEMLCTVGKVPTACSLQTSTTNMRPVSG